MRKRAYRELLQHLSEALTERKPSPPTPLLKVSDNGELTALNRQLSKQLAEAHEEIQQLKAKV